MPSSTPPLVPALGQVLHFVLCDFGPLGSAYVETDPTQADEQTIVRNLIAGEYTRPLHIIACNPIEGWSCDVSEKIARRLSTVDPEELSSAARGFVEAQLSAGRVRT
jgi:hypothetical protein